MALRNRNELGLSPMEKRKQLEKKAWEDFQKILEEFPHTFQLTSQLEHKDGLRDSLLKSVKNHLEAALKAGYHTEIERAQSLNLLAYVLFNLKEKQAALNCLEEALELYGQQDNIVSLANRAVIWYHSDPKKMRRTRAKEEVSKLRRLKASHNDFDYLIVKAKAELASSFMRFGPYFSRLAIGRFDEVIGAGREPEVWHWRLSLALAHRHTLDLQHVPDASAVQDQVSHVHVFEKFLDVKEKSGYPHLQANALAEMALVRYFTWDTKIGQALSDIAKAGSMQMCKEALRCDENEPSVLRKAGQLFRYYQDVHSSRKYLEKSVKLQESSAAYHHLGLTYKAFATEQKHGTLRRRRGRRLGNKQKGKWQRKRKTGQKTMERTSTKQSPTNEDSSDSETELKQFSHGNETGDLERDSDEEDTFVKGAKLERATKIVKSPPRDVTTFSWDDRYVKEAIENLQKAVEFSAGENTRAKYDLALMYKALGEYDDALACLYDIYSCSSAAGPLDIITAHEQAGLIILEKAEQVEDENTKEELKNEADSLLREALMIAFDMYAKCAQLRGQFGCVFQSPRTLLRAVRASDKCLQEKQMERAILFRLIQKHPKSLAILEKMAAFDPESANNVEYHVTFIRNHCDLGNFSDAVTSLKLLKATQLQLYGEVVEELGSDVQNMYIEAGRQALLQPSADAGIFLKSLLGSEAGEEHQEPADRHSSNSVLHGASAREGYPRSVKWDVVILHEEEEEEGEELVEKSAALAIALKHCGLRVWTMEENLPFGCQILLEIENTMQKSRFVAVLVGKGSLTEDLKHLLGLIPCMNVPSAFFLVDDTCQPAHLLAPEDRIMRFPTELLNLRLDKKETNITEAQASAIIGVLRFLNSCMDE